MLDRVHEKRTNACCYYFVLDRFETSSHVNLCSHISHVCCDEPNLWVCRDKRLILSIWATFYVLY
jgi:hypothetical protein